MPFQLRIEGKQGEEEEIIRRKKKKGGICDGRKIEKPTRVKGMGEDELNGKVMTEIFWQIERESEKF